MTNAEREKVLKVLEQEPPVSLTPADADRLLEAIDAEVLLCTDRISKAYWSFTRCAKGVPPSVSVADAYKRRNWLKSQRRKIKQAIRSTRP